MDTITIILIVAILVLLYVLYAYYTDSSSELVQTASLLTSVPPISDISGPKNTRYAHSVWIYVNTWDNNKEKVIFSRADNLKLYLDQTSPVLKLDVTMNNNTTATPSIEPMIITNNFPLQKWVNVTITFKQGKTGNNTMLNNLDDNLPNTVDVFVNGLLKSTKSFDTTPKLNDGDFWINMFGGFDGLIGKIKYFSRCVNFEKIQELVDDCPNDHTCGIDAVCPPYLDTDYWFS